MKKIKEYFKRIIELLEEISAKLDKEVSNKSQPGGPGQPGGDD